MTGSYENGLKWAKAMSTKLGIHEGSEGHPINFERSGDYHRMMSFYRSDKARSDFTDGYRQGWKEAISR